MFPFPPVGSVRNPQMEFLKCVLPAVATDNADFHLSDKAGHKPVKLVIRLLKIQSLETEFYKVS